MIFDGRFYEKIGDLGRAKNVYRDAFAVEPACW
jgi:hypothetical protein